MSTFSLYLFLWLCAHHVQGKRPIFFHEHTAAHPFHIFWLLPRSRARLPLSTPFLVAHELLFTSVWWRCRWKSMPFEPFLLLSLNDMGALWYTSSSCHQALGEVGIVGNKFGFNRSGSGESDSSPASPKRWRQHLKILAVRGLMKLMILLCYDGFFHALHVCMIFICLHVSDMLR